MVIRGISHERSHQILAAHGQRQVVRAGVKLDGRDGLATEGRQRRSNLLQLLFRRPLLALALGLARASAKNPQTPLTGADFDSIRERVRARIQSTAS